jgi:hypothetical protein
VVEEVLLPNKSKEEEMRPLKQPMPQQEELMRKVQTYHQLPQLQLEEQLIVVHLVVETGLLGEVIKTAMVMEMVDQMEEEALSRQD